MSIPPKLAAALCATLLTASACGDDDGAFQPGGRPLRPDQLVTGTGQFE